jgi:hypothetical protein
MEHGLNAKKVRDEWEDNEHARRLRIESAAKRPISVNLSEGIALSEFLSRVAASALRK